MLKISEAWEIPMILLGHSPTEANSFTSENIYDQTKLKAILEKNRFIIYPRLNFITSYWFTITGRFGRKINILYYLDIPSDKEIGVILRKELGWEEPDNSEYTRYFDCLAEPLTNYVREKRFGSSRHLPQLSNMIRNGEITREEALKTHADDQKKLLIDNYKGVLSVLDLTEHDLEAIERIPHNVYCNSKSVANLIFAKARKLIKR